MSSDAFGIGPVAGVHARIAEIQARQAELDAKIGRAPSPAPASSAQAANDFTAALGSALNRTTLNQTALGTTALNQTTLNQTGTSWPVTTGVDLSQFGNGQIPEQLLAPLPGTDERMAPEAASAFTAMTRAAAADDISLEVNDGYRPLHDQERLADELGLYHEGGLAAVPGTSNHGLGISIDLDLDADAQRWMQANAGRFGFVNDVPREPWHWTFQG